MLSITVVAGLPAAIVAGEKVAVAPGGRPLMLKRIVSGKVVPAPGLSIRLKLAAPPGVVLALLPEPLPVPTLRLNPVAATVKLVVTVALV
jgi:hypothetical protein